VRCAGITRAGERCKLDATSGSYCWSHAPQNAAARKSRARLFRADGSQVYADAEHAERLAALRAERNRVLQEVEEAARIEIEAARAELTALENGAPTALLTADELERANVRRGHIVDDVATLTQEELINRLEAVLHGGDRVSMFCYLQAGRRRVREIAPGRVPPELAQVLEDLAERLVPASRKAELEAARKRIAGAGEVRDLVWLARREQSSAYAPAYSFSGR
jgi:hypothetical protein